MTALIVSPSALLRSAFKELLAQVRNVDAVRELGSTLQLGSAMSQHDPDLVFLDEVLGYDPGQLASLPESRCTVVLLHARSPGGGRAAAGLGSGGTRVLRMEKPDFANASQADMVRVYGPLLDGIATEARERRSGAKSLLADRQGGVGLVVIGASTGGPAAVRTVLATLPADFPCPIALVQHIDTGYASGYADWLTQNTRLRVRLAVDGDRPRPGEVIVGPNDLHLVCQGESFGLDDGPKLLSQKPSVDRLFSSAARHHGSALVAVLLTGIGSDGAKGCLDIVTAGGSTLVQDEATSTVYGMPRAAAELNAATHILALGAIGPALLDLVEKRRPR
ncbi:MAG: CheB methylesterase domain-containing protein [Spirochaetota bacterium]